MKEVVLLADHMVFKRPGSGYTRLYRDGTMEILQKGKQVRIDLNEFVKVAGLPIPDFKKDWESFFAAFEAARRTDFFIKRR